MSTTGERAATPGRLRRGPSARTVGLAPLAPPLAAAAILALAYLLSAGVRSEVGRTVAILGRGDGDALRDYILSYGAWAPVASLLLMVLQALAAPVPAFLVVFANGLAFGVFWGGILSLVGQTLAAALCFWIARTFGRAPVEALVGKLGLESADRGVARWGARGVLVARLVPGMAFDAVSYAAGITRVGFGTFLAATVLGAAPQSFLYAYLGQSAPRFAWALLAATVLVGGAVAATACHRRRR